LSAPRSGSSALTSLLSDMGISMGAQEKLKQSDEYNPKGYFELKKVLEVNEKILREGVDALIWEIGKSFGWSRQETTKTIELFSWTVARNPIRPQDVNDSTREEITNITRSMSVGGEAWLLKDARMCATLPVWEEYIDPVCIVLWRHPAEVQRSLKKMTGIPTKISLQLWYAYSRMAFMVSDRHPRICLSYQDLIENTETVQEKIGRFLSDQGLGASRFSRSGENQIDISLYRNRNREGVALSAKQRDLYGALVSQNYAQIGDLDREDADTSLVPLIGMAAYLNSELSRRPGRRFINRIADIYHSIFGS